MKRWIAAALLAVVALVAGVGALQAEPEVATGPTAAGPTPLAPVLSLRRVPGALAERVGDRRLVGALESIASRAPTTSCLVVADGGRRLFERTPDAGLIPASTMKLVTALIAVRRLGPDTRLRTTVAAAQGPDGGVVDGDLFLIGGGDPVLGTEAWAASFDHQPALHTSLERLADDVVAAGVREVRGQVVGDEGRYDALRGLDSWPARYRGNGEIGPLSALTVNDGFAVFEPGRSPFPEPAAGAAQVLTGLLRARGVLVAGGGTGGRSPGNAEALASVDSPPVAELVGSMLRESDNGTSELLVKELGLAATGEGTTAAGTAQIEADLAELGLPTDRVEVVDGSGLDRGNVLTCGLLSALLDVTEEGDAVDAGLPVAAMSGTLLERFGGPVSGRLRAKTGSLNGISGLAGHAATRDGDDLTFSFLVNGLGTSGAAPLQDELALALVAYPDAPAVEALGPGAYAPP